MKIVQDIIAGLIAYVVSGYAIDALITGTTSAGDSMIHTLVPIGIAVGVVIASLGLRIGGGGQQQ